MLGTLKKPDKKRSCFSPYLALSLMNPVSRLIFDTALSYFYCTKLSKERCTTCHIPVWDVEWFELQQATARIRISIKNK